MAAAYICVIDVVCVAFRAIEIKQKNILFTVSEQDSTNHNLISVNLEQLLAKLHKTIDRRTHLIVVLASILLNKYLQTPLPRNLQPIARSPVNCQTCSRPEMPRRKKAVPFLAASHGRRQGSTAACTWAVHVCLFVWIGRSRNFHFGCAK